MMLMQCFSKKLYSVTPRVLQRAWPLRGIPCEGLQRGLGGSLRASRYLGKNTGVIDGSLHLSTLLFSVRIYIVCITPFAVEIATH